MADYGTVIETGSCGLHVNYAIYDSGTCVLLGYGDTEYYITNESVPFYNSKNDIKKAVVDGGITSIGSYLFAYCVNLTSVDLGDCIEHIGAYAFMGCSSLTEITLPKTLTGLGDRVFYLSGIKTVIFTGDGLGTGQITTRTFLELTDLICYYPANRKGWDSFKFNDYGATSITWVPYSAALYKYGIVITAKGGHSLQLRKPKLESGTAVTDWSPAPEDPDDDLYTRLSVLQTDFSVVQGEIQAKVWETDIEQATDGIYERMEEIYSYIDETLTGITAEVGDLAYTVTETYSELTAQISDLIITSEGIYSTVSDMEQYIYGHNIAMKTEDMSMSSPWDYYGRETSKVTNWSVFPDSSLPAGDAYAIVKGGSEFAGIQSGDISIYCKMFHWLISDDIFDGKRDKLENGKTYTLSFYMRNDSGETMYCMPRFSCYEQTYVSCSLSGAAQNRAQYPSSTGWSRVSITFKMTDVDNFRMGFSYGFDSVSKLEDYNGINICGLMLNEGDTADDWDNGSSGYFATISDVNTKIQQLSDSITATVTSITTDLEGEITALYSELEMLPGKIQLTVTSNTSGSASIILSADGTETGGTLYANGLRNAFANDTSAITISAGTITFNSNTFIVNSTYFSVTATGVITATSGTIGGWNIGTNSLYYGATSGSSTTAGVYLGTGGIRINSGTFGLRLNRDEADVSFYSGSTLTGYISSYYSSGIRIHANGTRDIYLEGDDLVIDCDDILVDSGSGIHVAGYTGHFAIADDDGKSMHNLTFYKGILTTYEKA